MNPEKLKKLQAQVRIGGKGTARRKKKIVHKTAAFAERKLQNAIQKISEVDLTEIDEVNIMKDDGEVIHFKNPSVQASRSANMVAISGQAEHKHVSEMLPNIIPQLGMDGLRYGANYALGIGDKNDLAIEPCNQVLSCGHVCSGIKDEKKCPPCLQPECCVNESSQTGYDYCMICLTELSEFPIIQLKCGHVYHFECAKDVLKKRWPDTRMSFHFSLCPICMEPIEHRELMTLLEPINALQNEVMKKSLLMLQNEGLENSDAITDPNSFYYNNPEQYAMDRYSFYQCNICKKPYFGGVAQCEGGAVAEVKVEELVCPPCSGPQIAQPCNIHGTDFLYFKCKYCCSVAVYFCFGNTHFCDACHTDYRNLLWMDAFNMLPQCPAGPSGKQLSGKCPLGVQHSPNGKECCLGCELCRINTV